MNPDPRLVKKSLLITGLLILCSLTTGCAIHPEGVGFSTAPDRDDWIEIRSRWEQNKEAAITTGTGDPSAEPGVIVIGRVGPFRDFSNPDVFAAGYNFYSQRMTAAGETANMLSQDDLRTLASGWTTITYWVLPPIAGRISRAYVLHGQKGVISFSSLAGTLLYGTREDLVAGISTVTFPFTVLSALLCKDDKDYSSCASDYKRGLYDAHSGRELTADFVIKEGGSVIDTSTFKIVNP